MYESPPHDFYMCARWASRATVRQVKIAKAHILKQGRFGSTEGLTTLIEGYACQSQKFAISIFLQVIIAYTVSATSIRYTIRR
jgi:hypothetical protein